MAARLRVKRRDAHEAMDALLRLEEAVGIMALDEERCALDAGLIARQQVSRLDREAVALGPAAVHAQQHLRPVLRLCSARTGVQRQDGIVGIVRAGEQHLKLQSLEAFSNRCELRLDVIFHALILLFHAHLPECLSILELADEVLVLVDADLDVIEFLVDLLGLLCIVPERRFTHLVFELGNLLFLRRDLERFAHLVQLRLEFAKLRFDIFEHNILSSS